MAREVENVQLSIACIVERLERKTVVTERICDEDGSALGDSPLHKQVHRMASGYEIKLITIITLTIIQLVNFHHSAWYSYNDHSLCRQ